MKFLYGSCCHDLSIFKNPHENRTALQTSSGKTHTMMGTPHEPGIVPLAVRAIFDHIEATQDREFLLRVSYMEVRSRVLNRVGIASGSHRQLHVIMKRFTTMRWHTG